MNKIYLFFVVILLSVSVQGKVNTSNSPKRIEITNDKPINGQVIYADTYYVIKDVIDLKGASVSVPRGSTLKFEGGEMANGKVIGNDTYIDASPIAVFSENILLEGTFLASEAYPEWFADKDDAVKIRRSVELFDNVKLTAKHYVLESVDENGYGVTIPSGHILRGNRKANNTMADDQVLKMKRGIKYKAVVALSTSSVIENLTIWGEGVEGTAGVATATGFQSRLTISNVGVSGCYYGFNLQTYLTSISQCVANYNQVGFYVHGSYTGNTISVEGTSVNMSTCFAVDSRKTGYEIAGITYSTMNNCAADGCGALTSGTLDNRTEIGYAYFFYQCKDLAVNSCGAEACLAALKTYNCKNIIFNSPSYLIAIRDKVNASKGYQLQPIINISYSAYIEINLPFLEMSRVKKYYTDRTPLVLLYGSAMSSPSLTICNGYEGIKESNIKTEGYLTKTKNLIFR